MIIHNHHVAGNLPKKNLWVSKQRPTRHVQSVIMLKEYIGTSTMMYTCPAIVYKSTAVTLNMLNDFSKLSEKRYIDNVVPAE